MGPGGGVFEAMPVRLRGHLIESMQMLPGAGTFSRASAFYDARLKSADLSSCEPNDREGPPSSA